MFSIKDIDFFSERGTEDSICKLIKCLSSGFNLKKQAFGGNNRSGLNLKKEGFGLWRDKQGFEGGRLRRSAAHHQIFSSTALLRKILQCASFGAVDARSPTLLTV